MKLTKKKYSVSLRIALAFLFSNIGLAQQTPTFPEYNYNPFIINAAYAGLTQNTEVTLSNSGFLNGFDGSPRSFAFSGHGALKNEKIGLGASILRDEIGVMQSTHFLAAFSYKIRFKLDTRQPYWQIYTPGVFSFGITAGVQQYENNLLSLGIAGDQSFAQNINTTIPTIGAGILYNHATFYVGFSTPNLIGNSLASSDDFELSTPYFGYLGYRFYNNRFQDFIVKPNMLIKYEDGAPVQLDFNTAVNFKNKFEIGAGYRTSNALNFLAGIYLFNHLRFIYNYNIALEGGALGNRHGLVFSFQFGDGYGTE